MSLVNDALKRAKEAQQKTPPTAPGPQLRPAEPTPTPPTGRGTAMLVPIILVLIAVVGFVLIWPARRRAVELPQKVEAKAPPANSPVETKPPVQPAAISIPNTAVTPPATQKPAASPTAPAPTVSIPSSPKLQAIFFTPGHPSAIINGKTVRVGDMIKGFRVAAITQTSATLVNTTQTNVMTLEEQ